MKHRSTRNSGLLVHCAAVVCLLTLGRASAGAAATNATEKAAGCAGFHHPGVVVNRAQLDFIKAKVAAGAEPWKSAFEAAKASEFGALSYTPHPRDTCECGPFSK